MKRLLRSAVVVFLGAISVLYLLNIGVGVVELIPDNVPFVGNLDEGTAVVLLLNCLRYFGLDLGGLFSGRDGGSPPKTTVIRA